MACRAYDWQKLLRNVIIVNVHDLALSFVLFECVCCFIGFNLFGALVQNELHITL